ncbi:MAG: alpha/beta fold hydrolase [Anaerolineaceae bacterium]|jgi:carboxylesterase|nr:alpha/beta fold hydrolase [Anaerolineaceae bacterium]HNX45646.1 alpha/beta fold hydrolase [Anaerolineaceae bacterium]HPT23389.1 alpha/beta fold hydrolase [Anaerolineaceae bacterium]
MSNQYMKNPELDGEPFIFEGNSVGVLLLHGFTATTAEVRYLAERLREKGYTVSAPLLPGHGTHPDDLNQTKWLAWYEAAEASYLDLRQRCERVFIGGESMGGLLALLIASRYAKVDGVMLFAPALEIPQLSLVPLLQHFKKYQPKHYKEDNLAWKGYNVYPLKGLAQLVKLQKVVKKELPQVTQPTLIFMGKLDTSVPLSVGEKIYDGIESNHKELINLENSPHVMLLAEEKDLISQQVGEFIEDILSSPTEE